jgi:hypothetical protein
MQMEGATSSETLLTIKQYVTVSQKTWIFINTNAETSSLINII